jgi:hypothetical protein
MPSGGVHPITHSSHNGPNAGHQRIIRLGFKAVLLPDQRRKKFRPHRYKQREYAADGQPHNRATSYSAPKHSLFSGRHFFSPAGFVIPTANLDQRQPFALDERRSTRCLLSTHCCRDSFRPKADISYCTF